MYSPLQLKQYSLQEIAIRERDASLNDVTSNWIPGEPQVKLDFATAADDQYQSRIILTVSSKATEPDDSTAAWDFSVRIAGYFEFTDKSCALDKAKKLSLVNGASIVYGLARDLLHATTLRGQKPSILLPCLNFTSWANSLDEKETAAKASKSTAKPKGSASLSVRAPKRRMDTKAAAASRKTTK